MTAEPTKTDPVDTTAGPVETHPPGAETGRRPRLFAIDNLRILLTAMVVIHHVALTYSHIPLWYYTELSQDATGTALDILLVIDQAFFMGFFFLISGFFTPGSRDRKGGGAFMRDRLIRLGIPLLAFALLLRPLVDLGTYKTQYADVPYWQFYLASWSPGPMWFVEVLIVFAALYALWRRFGRPMESRRTVLKVRWIVLFTAGLAVATVLWRIPVPTGAYVPVLGLPTPYFLPQYASMFVLGCIAFRRGWFETLPAKAGPIGMATAGVVTAVLVPAVAMTTGELNTIVMATWESTFAVSIIIGLTVWFRQRFNTQRPRGKWLSDQAFTVYIIHPLVLVAVSYALAGLHALSIVKFAVVAVIALPLCWGLAYLVRSIPGFKRVL
jgi:glucan biosynthesis protein C